MSKPGRKKLSKNAWKVIGLALLALLTAGAVAFALTPPAPAPPTIDIAAVEAKRAQQAADKAAKEAAEIEAGKVDLTFPAERPLKMLLAGDSLTAGWHATVETNSFRVKVVDALKSKGPVEVVGAYFAGAKTQDVATQKPPAKDLNADLAIIELGTNDYNKLTEPEVFRSQYAGYLDAVKATSPNVKFLCAGAWATAQGKVQEYDNVIKEVCEARGGKFFDLRSIAYPTVNRSVPGQMSWAGPTDSGHPSDAGHQAIADVITQRLSKLLA